MHTRLTTQYTNNAIDGFTLAELLIALAILAVIATFTIPKILQSQSNAKYNAIARETAAMLSEAYTVYKMDNTVTAATKPNDLKRYINYMSVPSGASLLDGWPTEPNTPCNDCIKLHNGAVLVFWDESFGDTNATNAIRFMLDPDGKVTDSTTTGPNKSVCLHLYLNGRIVSWGNLEPNTKDSVYTWNPTPAKDPSWFSWN